MSTEEHAELESLAEEAHASFRNELTEAIESLRELLTQGDPLYIAALIQVANVIAGWGTYFEPTQRGGENKVELVAGLLVSQPVAKNPEGPTDEQIQKIHDEIDHILGVSLLFNLSMPRGEDLDAASIRFTGALHWMTLRGHSYTHHGADLARALYSPYDEWMLGRYAFSVNDVLRLGETVERLVTTRLNALIKEARGFSDRVIEHLDSESGEARLTKEEASDLLSGEGRFRIGGAAFMYVFQQGVRQATTFTLEEVCAANVDLSLDNAKAVLTELSIPVGSLQPSDYTGLFDESPLIGKPFLEFNGRYLLAVPGMVFRDTVQLLEARFMSGPTQFSLARAKTLDALAVKYLGSMLPGSTTYTNLFYAGAELDGLVLFEDIAFVAEGKGTALSVQAHRGDIRRLTRDIGRAVEEAWQQGARARAFILGDHDAAFTDENGTEVVRIKAGSVREVIIVNPTLHELGGHAPQLGRLRALGLFPEGELPWSVFINDLRVISETCDNAAIFLHYLVWRARLPLGERLRVSDELDVWASYLLCERFGMLSDVEHASIANATTDFDAYYDGLLGHGPTSNRPAKFLREPVKRFVGKMASERPPGWREAAGACLDMSIPELAAVCLSVRDVSRSATREGVPLGMEFGRVKLVGIPKDANTARVVDQFELVAGDSTLLVFSQSKPKREEIVWAKYAKPVTFELSDFEKAGFNAPETSPFTSE